jgi:diguanylate cyclase (GGDEF)-like protein
VVNRSAPPGPATSVGDTADETLRSAHDALDDGNTKEARELAQSVLIAAKSSGDRRLQANALACLAQCDRIGSRLRRAADTARRAAQIFESLSDTQGEARSLATLSQVSMLLGRTDEAYESAVLSLRLCEAEGASQQLVIAHTTLGVVSCWAGNFERAHQWLETAIVVGEQCDPPISGFEPRLNQSWVEAFRLVDERYRTGSMSSLDRMARLVDEFHQLEGANGDAALMAGLAPMTRTVACVMSALLAAWQGQIRQAKLAMTVAERSLLGTVTWLDALVRWGVAELAWAQRDWAVAEAALAEMKSMSLAVEYEQLACTAHQLLIQVLEEQGKSEAVRQEHRGLRVRERRLVTESMEGRLAVVDWRLNARRSERNLQEALVASKQFEKWSLEDALTGLANRRHAEHVLAERLRAAAAHGRPLTVAMIDVDKFKRINDQFSHAVGDRVLKTLGAIMASQVREHDLAARWAGDEFVILFADAEEHIARQACGRMHTAIAAFDWELIAAGLAVSVSIGLSQAGAGDTLDELLERSDERMYESKSMTLDPLERDEPAGVNSARAAPVGPDRRPS